MKIISTALFGTGDKYAQYLSTFVRAVNNLFPRDENWFVSLYCSQNVDDRWKRLVNEYRRLGLLWVTVKEDAELTRAMLWRMDPLFNSDAQYVFCRDLDALPMPRDRAVCEQFMVSGCFAHTVHDNRYHVGMMGGLCGFHAPSIREITGWKSLDDLYRNANESSSRWAKHGTDQDVLNRTIAAKPAMRLLEHRFNGWTEGRPTPGVRSAGFYQCQCWSTPLPDVGMCRLSLELSTEADRLANHLGSAGYDQERAAKFWDEHGDPQIAARCRDAERGVL